jgi:NitT/TauT family transport system substrate-binding protein
MGGFIPRMREVSDSPDSPDSSAFRPGRRLALSIRGRLAPLALLSALLAALLALTTLAGCGSTSSPNTGSGGTGGGSDERVPLTVGLTYVPNIQFAPFYVAEALGYYRDAGLDVTLRHHNAGEDEFAAIAAGRENVIFAGGDETLQARAKGLPLVYVANIFTSYPVALIVPADSPIHSLADLRGRTVGVPGQYGATYIGLLALLKSAGLSPSAVTIQSIGYTQVPALIGHKVDAVMGYVNNEPIQFQKAGFAIRTFPVAAAQPPVPLISNGLAAQAGELKAQPAAVKALIDATLKGVAYTRAHPQEAVTLSKQFVPGLADPNTAASALAVLQATLPVLEPNSAHPGYNDPAAWQAMASFLQASGQLNGAVDVTQAYSNDYLPA